MQASRLPWDASLLSAQEREDVILSFIESLPRSSLSKIQKRIEPLLYVDIVGLLPNELALVALSHLSSKDLLSCRLVSKRWRTLADDYTLWKGLCIVKGWQWKDPTHSPRHFADIPHSDTDDEGMGDEEDDMTIESLSPFDDSGVASTVISPVNTSGFDLNPLPSQGHFATPLSLFDDAWGDLLDISSSPSRLRTPLSQLRATKNNGASSQRDSGMPNYKLLYLTHALLRRRFLTGSYRLSYLQSRGSPNSHTSTIYCLQLYTYPETGVQVLFTGSRDRTIREWDLTTGKAQRVISGIHEGSVLSLCARNGLLASAGSDGRTILYELHSGKVKAILQDHTDSVLCVRFNGEFLASCSKDRSIRLYRMPDLKPHTVLLGHRAAVNTIALSASHVISASGDKSVRIWDVLTGRQVKIYENHHSRGIASIDAEYPAVLTGSSDQHIRLFDIQTEQGWSTSARFDPQAAISLRAPSLDEDACSPNSTAICQNCGSSSAAPAEPSDGVRREDCSHSDLVRSVAMNADFIVSGSYDHRIKVWCRKTGRQVADLSGGHTGRVFCVDFDHTKVVSCGEDQQICIWSFAHGGIDTSFIPL